MQSADIKQAAHQLIDQLPEDCSWNDEIYEMVVRQEIEPGLEDSDAGCTMAGLKLIYEYIDEVSSQAAIQVVDRITARSRQLDLLPISDRQVPEYQRVDVREVLERPYRIIYKINSGQIDILTVMHYRQILPADARRIDDG